MKGLVTSRGKQAKAQAVQSGAFGGSRGGIEQAEIGRNILQQQAKNGAQLRSQGYQQAAQQAQQSFEQAQGRQQNLGQLTSPLAKLAQELDYKQHKRQETWAYLRKSWLSLAHFRVANLA